MKVKFISTTNEMMQPIEGYEGTLGYSMTARFSFDAVEGTPFDFRHGYFTTSQINNINIHEISFNCFDIKITTNNSIYLFRHGEISDKPAWTKEEKRLLAGALLM
jgi:hypothetical protein